MHNSRLSTLFLSLSISLNLNLDLALAAPVPILSSSEICSSLSSVHFLTPRAMSVLGIHRRCMDIWGQEDELHHTSFSRQALDALIAKIFAEAPNADDGEHHNPDWQIQRRGPKGSKGLEHDLLAFPSSDDEMQEPLDGMFVVKPARVEHATSRLPVKEVYQDDIRVAGLSMSRFSRHRHTQCHQTTRKQIAAWVQRKCRRVEGAAHKLYTEIGSMSDSIIIAVAVAIGILVLVLLSLETALGPRKLRFCRQRTSDSESSRTRLLRSERGRRINSKRFYFRSLDTIPEIDPKVASTQLLDRDLEEKEALMVSFAH